MFFELFFFSFNVQNIFIFTDPKYLDAVFEEAYSNVKFNIPPVPPDGLFLDRLFFDAYNKNVEMVGKGARDALALHTPEIETKLEHFKGKSK